MSNFSDILAKGTKAVCGRLYKSFKDDTAKLMIAASAIGLILAGASNTLGIVVNKKVSKKEKSYLIPMELTDSVMSLGTFYFASNSTKKLAEKLVDSNKIDLRELKNPALAKSGITIIATILGSVIASNILTPIIRNKVGARIQKKLMEKAGVEKNQEIENKIYLPLPNNKLNIPKTINAYKAYVRKGNLTV